MPSARDAGRRFVLRPRCRLRRLEHPALYDAGRDCLYELDEEAFAALAAGLGGGSETADLAAFCREEGLVEETSSPRPVAAPPAPPLLPSLRYLLLHLTDRCNLSCRHCFLGRPAGRALSVGTVDRLAAEFDRLQGLRLIVSGGEPLLHPGFREINERLPAHGLRTVLLTNGTLVDRETARSLHFDEVQVSLDGIEESHDLIRGTGAFRRAVAGLDHLASAGVALSVATMIHAGNVGHLEALGRFLQGYSLRSWSIDAPCLSGALTANRELLVPPETAGPLMRLSFGGGYYGSTGDFTCGAHLAAVMPDGSVCRCSHYPPPPGTAGRGLAAAWKAIRRPSLGDLDCRCSHLADCRGGCRFRAETHSCQTGPDPLQCWMRGVPVGGDRCGEDATDPSRSEGR